jgi:hypothetical protein
MNGLPVTAIPAKSCWCVSRAVCRTVAALSLEVLDVANVTDHWLDKVDTLDLPRVDVPEAGLTDASIADVLRWARDTFPSRYSSATA